MRIALPLVVGIGAVLGTVVVHAMALVANLGLVRRERAAGRFGRGFWTDLRIVGVAVVLALTAHMLEIGGWAALLVGLGEFPAFDVAFYHSAMSYTTLGYADVVMSPAWQVLGPIEATDGMLMFGVSTAMIFAVIQRLVYVRLPEMRP